MKIETKCDACRKTFLAAHPEESGVQLGKKVV